MGLGSQEGGSVMCGCSGGGSVIIQCGGGASSTTSPTSPPQTQPGGAAPPTSSPPPEPPCKEAIVHFELIHVLNSGAVLREVDEPWNLFLDANGNAATVTNPLQTQDDVEFPLGAGGNVVVAINASSVI